MLNQNLKPNFIFESSWEVCNKVGGIYTVLATRANTMQQLMEDRVVFVGPDLGEHSNKTFAEDKSLLASWQAQAQAEGLKVRVGRWLIPGQPIVVLVDFGQFYSQKDAVYAALWEHYGVDSLHAYGDYDEASMFALAVGKVVESMVKFKNLEIEKLENSASRSSEGAEGIVFHANEWMLGIALLYVKRHLPHVATVFTTHATTVGRSIAGNGKELYGYLPGYYGDQMARELNVESKHSIEKAAAQQADCFTTVSAITGRECEQLLERKPDKLLLNGFEDDFVPTGFTYNRKRADARERLLTIANKLTGKQFPADTLIISTSGRYEFRNKGIDVFIEAINQLRFDADLKRQVLAFIEVPAWVAAPRQDLADRLTGRDITGGSLTMPYITHWLHNTETDSALSTFRRLGIQNLPEEKVTLVFVPCYLDGRDGIVNLHYYDVVLGNDLCIYPSYYEPWGYTPLEAIAFGVPCVTTDLAGFGLWAREVMKGTPTIENGVEVVHRSDANYWDVVAQIKQAVMRFASLTPAKAADARRKATALSKQALWKHFFTYYKEAYAIALNNAKKRTQE